MNVVASQEYSLFSSLGSLHIAFQCDYSWFLGRKQSLLNVTVVSQSKLEILRFPTAAFLFENWIPYTVNK